MKVGYLKNSDAMASWILRISLAIVIFPHGAQKLFGWFGGYGFSGTMGFFTETMNLPWLIGFFTIMLESIGAIVLILGFKTRIVAALYLILAIAIVFTSHLEHGFFMNWFGNQQGEGYEYFLLWIGMAISLILSGGGEYSIDGILKLRQSKT